MAPCPTAAIAAVLLALAASASASTRANPTSGILAATNTQRAQHGASALVWDDGIASNAQTWANTCQYQHSTGASYGENLYATAAAGTVANADVQLDCPGSFCDDEAIGHFAQVVWDSTTKLGCGAATCSDGMTLVVCQYDPPRTGMEAQGGAALHQANVLRTTCQTTAADDSCSTCSGGTCSACYASATNEAPVDGSATSTAAKALAATPNATTNQALPTSPQAVGPPVEAVASSP
ncbi:fruiting body Sc7 [Micractinium conductrix]|uniref:Fruiting body Sc7 n=1 Tax=Micractinium conductrix TaxID=554055 RepID=A0A2P6VIG6_9CHLO|nr:fruiting body Sc7 [Micractinium conductrix]|eukprot:PSC73870.1 fruiting body Sc7 [Micractinium conductrix]